MTECPVCKQKHFPLSVYKDWIKRYSKGTVSKGLEAQLLRWQEMIDQHKKSGPSQSGVVPAPRTSRRKP